MSWNNFGCLPGCGQPTSATFSHALGCPNAMTPPSPPQSAEELYDEAREQLSLACADVDPRSWHASREAEAACRAALDACLRAVYAERGHVAWCDCTVRAFRDDPRCAPPSWLPPEVKP